MKQKTLGQVAYEQGDPKMPSLYWNELGALLKRTYETMARAVVREHEKRKGVCHWYESTDGFWETSCKLEWEMINDSTPKENEMRYCPKCGKRIKVGK